MTTVSHQFMVAAGQFGPGHVGELTQVVPFDLVDAVLKETRCVQRRLRDLPTRVGVYFLLAMCLFPEVGYRLVWQKLTAALAGAGVEVASPTAKALRDLRRRVGAAPVRRLFEVLVGPLARPTTPGVRFGPFRTVFFDGCSSITLPESDRNLDYFGPQSRGGYPMLELMTLVETGTRALIGAVFGPTSDGETAYAAACCTTWARTCWYCGTRGSTPTPSSPPWPPPVPSSWAVYALIAAPRPCPAG
ncbi:transposase domain-containing protein [Streptomyces sp. NPDC059680]|uniref:transposase domain-containing protein n=1 Tax=Streptomyces sp. NPDC059680 TaxID=3346904 RepID=UPI0036D0A83C